MIDRVRRFIGLFASRYQDYTELFAAKNLEETFPAYAPQLEQGIAQTGYAVFFRSSVLENYMRKDFFPLNLLQSCELADGRLSESCASS